MSQQIDPEIIELIPHRAPMLLINKVISLSAKSSSAIVSIDKHASFFQSEGVPSWIGLEYMGQTAALIAGFQLREGLVQPHLGFLLGTRQYLANTDYFLKDQELLITCKEAALVGDSLATFTCTIEDNSNQQNLATASLSVFRKPLEQE